MVPHAACFSWCRLFSSVLLLMILQNRNHSRFSPIPACFADEELPLDQDGAEILSETFSILSLKEMKLHVGSGAAGGAAGEDGDEDGGIATMTKKVLQAAQKKLVQQVSGGGRVLSVYRWRSRRSRSLLPLVVHRSTRRSS